jgi:hypothetical protein
MRITIDIPAPLYQRLKSRAAREGSSVKRLIVRGVERFSVRNVVSPRASASSFL